MIRTRVEVETILAKNKDKWMERDLTDIGATNPCLTCSEPAISVGNGLCYDCFKEALHSAILKDNPVSGPELLEKLKKKGMDI